MPIYEYTSHDGTKLELLRSMADADKPVDDPAGKGRVFKRVLSTFAAQGGTPGAGKGAGHVHLGAGCGCGKPSGSCGSRN
jgi:predicted nucleic acid-binding Zn ribbon protein